MLTPPLLHLPVHHAHSPRHVFGLRASTNIPSDNALPANQRMRALHLVPLMILAVQRGDWLYPMT